MSVADRLTLITADGAIIPLDGTHGVDARRGVKGAELPPMVISTIPRIVGAGAWASSVRYQERQLIQPLLIEPDHGDTRYVLRQLAGWFGVRPCTLRWEDAYGGYRQLEQVYCRGGLDGDENADATAPDGSWRVVTAELVALDPWWYGAELSVNLPVTMRTASNAAVASSGRIPSDGGGPTTISIVGDVDPDGYVELTGPFTRYTLATQTHQWTTSRTRSLAAGEKLIVDSRLATYGPRLISGRTDWDWLTWISTPFDVPASGALIVGAWSGVGAAARYVYRPRWSTP